MAEGVNPEILALLRRRLEDAERNLQLAKQHLKDLLGNEGTTRVPTRARATPAVTPAMPETTPEGTRVIHGSFDGEHMEGEDSQLYPVPANYASKSKLVEGDKLKLTIGVDGAFIYKQVSPVDRRRVLGAFAIDENGAYVVEAEGKKYRVLLASVTFYRLEPGDKVTILLPSEGEAIWGAVENAMKGDLNAALPELPEDREPETPTPATS